MSIPPVQLSKHFSDRELACPCCNVCAVDAGLLLALEELRSVVSTLLKRETPLKILSGYRCEKHNRVVGGAKSSEHTQGRAADVAVPQGMDMLDFYHCVGKVAAFQESGIGLYPAEGFIHADVKRGKPARWARVGGSYVGIDVGLAEALKAQKKRKGK